MIAMNLPAIPMPDRVAARAGCMLPVHVLQAVATAREAVADVRRYRAPLFTEDREDALARLAAANKILAAYNPGLIETPKAVTA